MTAKHEPKLEQSSPKKRSSAKSLALALGIALVIIGMAAAALYFRIFASRIYDEGAEVSAPHIGLSVSKPEKLEEVYVHEGDKIPADFLVARAGTELVKTKTGGLVVFASREIGKTTNPGEAIVTLIRPDDSRIVARVEENKGFREIKTGQKVIFTVDAFGSREFSGIVDEVSPASRESALTFSISSQRPTKEFNVKIRYDVSKYPEIKDGMSAKVWIYK